jgi:putative ABC transport system permease protein
MTDSAMTGFYRELEIGLRSAAGIRDAGIATTTPLSNNFDGTIFRVPGRPPAPRGHELSANDQRVTPGYLDASGVRIVSGRGITSQDVAGAQRVIVVSQMMADALWPHESALNRVVTVDSQPWTIVGVASDVHHGGLDEPLRYTIYRSLMQAPLPYGVVAVWTAGRPESAREAVRHVITRTNPSVAVGETMTMEQMLARHVSPFAMMADMLGVLAAVTMTIAVVALYGLIAYGVAQRTRELGVRIALGARPRDILMQVAGGAMRLTLIALVFGIAGAAVFARLLVALLYRVRPSDPSTYAVVSLGLLVVAVSSALIPSVRAARVDPMLALRHD